MTMDNFCNVFVLCAACTLPTLSLGGPQTVWSWSYDREDTNTTYRLINTTGSHLTWTQAQDGCSNVTNGSLAALHVPDVLNSVMEHLGPLLKGEFVWLGGKQHTSTGFYWLNSSTMLDNIPDDKTCAVLTKSGDATLKSFSCFSRVEGYICSINTSIDTDDCNDRVFDRSTVNVLNTTKIKRRCVYIIKSIDPEEVTWYGARNSCLLAGGDLFTSQDAGDLSHVIRVLQNVTYWIGATRSNWTWVTSNGSSYDNITFTNWSSFVSSDEREHRANCLATTTEGWKPLHCEKNKTKLLLCQTQSSTVEATTIPGDPVTLSATTTFLAQTSMTKSPAHSSNVESDTKLYIIGGSLGGAVVIFISIAIVLVICIKKSKRKRRRINETSTDYETRDFSFLNIAVTPRQMSSSSATSTSGGSTEPSSPTGNPVILPRNGAYENTADVRFTRKTEKDMNPYASTSTNDVINRENNNKQQRHSRGRAGNALNGLKKRLSWLIKRGGSEGERPTSGDQLPLPPDLRTSLSRGPDVIPQNGTGFDTSRNNLYHTEGDDSVFSTMSTVYEVPSRADTVRTEYVNVVSR